MFDSVFAWLESSWLSVWVRESPSVFAFPGILAAHTVGLGLLAGLNAALDLRLLGVARGIPPTAFIRFLPIMRVGLWINIASGVVLLIGYPTKAMTNPVFYLKLTLIAVAILILRRLLALTEPTGAGRTTRVLAAASLLAWAGAITAGRLLAYTCTRLMVDFSC